MGLLPLEYIQDQMSNNTGQLHPLSSGHIPGRAQRQVGTFDELATTFDPDPNVHLYPPK
ncbi:MAG: hypothetical protein JJE46_08560 [Acidimicrobiia bacterium]|nr:hypothetical protein [Acidimicrobiia bacterium]